MWPLSAVCLQGWVDQRTLGTQRMQPCTLGRDLGGVTERLSNYQDMAMYVRASTDGKRRVGDVGMYS